MHRRAHTLASTLDPKGLWSLGCQALENCPHFVLESPGGLNGGGSSYCAFICASADFQMLGFLSN